MRVNSRWTGAAAALGLAVVATVSACTDDASTPSSDPPISSSFIHSGLVSTSTSPNNTASPNPTDLAKAEVLASYKAYWAAQVSSEAHPRLRQDPNLAKFAIAKALADAQGTILLFRNNGIEMRGRPTHSATVTSISLSKPPRAVIKDCLDSTHWRPVYAATGKSALAPGQSVRITVDATATLYQGRWVVRTSVAHRDRPC